MSGKEIASSGTTHVCLILASSLNLRGKRIQSLYISGVVWWEPTNIFCLCLNQRKEM